MTVHVNLEWVFTMRRRTHPGEEWIRDELKAAFEKYGSAYPDVTKAFALDRKAVNFAEASRRKDFLKPLKSATEADAITDSFSRRLHEYLASDKAQSWFAAESERIARLDSKSLMNEVKEAIKQGPESSRWIAEILVNIYIAGLGKDTNAAAALGLAAEGCAEPWRSQLKQFRASSAELWNQMDPSVSGIQGLASSLRSAQLFGFKNTANAYQKMLSAVRSNADLHTVTFEAPPPTASWWTREYLDWFLATTWDMLSSSKGICDTPSQLCEEMLMARRPYICFDGSEKHRLFVPGLALTMWMLGAQQKADPYWDQAFYFSTGTHFALLLAPKPLLTKSR